MKYDKENTEKLIQLYKEHQDAQIVADLLGVPKRSAVAKLTSLGLYKRVEYTSKSGERPVKKEEYIERIAELLEVSIEIIESLEKANKNVLILLEKALK